MNVIALIGGLLLILVGANALTDGAASVAKRFNISSLVIGLTIVAFGTSAPELTVSIVSALKGSADMAIGNVVGSNIFNLLAVLGLTATIAPVETNQINWLDMGVMVGSSLLLLPFMRTGFRIGRGEGIVLFAIYAAYTVYLLV